MNTLPVRKPERKVYLDALRLFAILCVLFNHTNTRGFAIFTIRTESLLFPFYLFCAVLCKVAVPLFWIAFPQFPQALLLILLIIYIILSFYIAARKNRNEE